MRLSVCSMGALFIGMVVANTWVVLRSTKGSQRMTFSRLYGSALSAFILGFATRDPCNLVSIVQAYYYYRHQNDNWILLSLVGFRISWHSSEAIKHIDSPRSPLFSFATQSIKAPSRIQVIIAIFSAFLPHLRPKNCPVYTYLITNFGNFEELGKILP